MIIIIEALFKLEYESADPCRPRLVPVDRSLLHKV